jgi:hypothetical protein
MEKIILLLITFALAWGVGCTTAATKEQKPEINKPAQEKPIKTTSTPPEQKTDGVAFMGGLDMLTQMHIANLLSQNGIAPYIEGSTIYGLDVPAGQGDKAKKLIEESVNKIPNSIVVSHTDSGVLGIWGNRSNMYMLSFNKSCKEVLEDSKQKYYSIISAMLNHPDIKGKIKTFKYIEKMQVVERNYADKDGSIAIGYEVELYLSVDLNMEVAGFKQYAQVWDDGKNGALHGSNEWWHGTPETVERNKRKYEAHQNEDRK